MSKAERFREEVRVWTCRVITTIALVTFIIVYWKMLSNKMSFERECSSHLKIAVTTDDLTFAKENLLMAVTYAEEHNLTRGGCDGCVGIWYRNLKNTYLELEQLPKDMSEVERLYVLSWLRSSLEATGTQPQGWRPELDMNLGYTAIFFCSVMIFIIVGARCERYDPSKDSWIYAL